VWGHFIIWLLNCWRRNHLPRFLFIVHALSNEHRRIIGVRGAKLGLSLDRRDGSDPRDVSHICSFSLPSSRTHAAVHGDVVAIPLTPKELLIDQDRAVRMMHRAVKVSERTGPSVDVVGLGSLCAVVGGRGVALQDRLSVPVTTGGAATVWTMFSNAIQANPHREPMGVLGSSSPVGKALIKLLHAQRFPLIVDSKKSIRGLTGQLQVRDSLEIAGTEKWLIGCGPTGPIGDESVLQTNTTVLDVALPHTFAPEDSSRCDIRTFYAERMTMPDTWKRGVWGRIYHLVSGYGYRTVLACLVEPVVMAANRRTDPYALGRSLDVADVLDFGRQAANLGFHPTLSSDFWRGVR
jgi:predicted amino acid dehydrogenase